MEITGDNPGASERSGVESRFKFLGTDRTLRVGRHSVVRGQVGMNVAAVAAVAAFDAFSIVNVACMNDVMLKQAKRGVKGDDVEFNKFG